MEIEIGVACEEIYQIFSRKFYVGHFENVEVADDRVGVHVADSDENAARFSRGSSMDMRGTEVIPQVANVDR